MTWPSWLLRLQDVSGIVADEPGHSQPARGTRVMAREAHGHGKILGGGMVGTHAGSIIGEIALAIERGADAVGIGKTIHPHPTLGESIGMAAEGGAWKLHGFAAGLQVSQSDLTKTILSQ